MICRYYKEGQKLNVADLNEITVLIDRSETELTEVAFNEWRRGLTGPPHRHTQKEQIFFIMSGAGTITIADETFEVKPDDLLYVPVGVTHQTIVTSQEPLGYILFNAFSNSDKEGHASFADHIAKVKATRKKQAETQQADADLQESEVLSTRRGKHINDVFSGKRFESGSKTTISLLDRAEAERCETMVVSWAAGSKEAPVACEDKERTLFVLSGTGSVTIGNETRPVKPGDTVFVPRNTLHMTEAGQEQLDYLSLDTVVARQEHGNF